MNKYRDKKVVIFGLGTYEKGAGISAALFLARKGAKLLITDSKTKKQLSHQIKKLEKYTLDKSGKKNIEYVLGKHRNQDFVNIDFVFKNPSVPKHSEYLEIARKNNIPVINDWTIYFEEKPGNILIGITGTKGKSVTTALIHHIIKTAGKDVVLCGNIGQSPIAILKKIKKNTIVVAELSSWSLQQFDRSPHIAVLTNLMPDHLDKYKNLREYYDDKRRIYKFQKPGDHFIKEKQGIEAATEVAKFLKIPQKTINQAIKTFKGVTGRLEFVREKNGIIYINDTCATMPHATVHALHQLKKTCPEQSRRIILIAGGVDKKLNYKKLAQEIPKYCKALILLKGTASEKIIKNLEIQNPLKIKTDVSSMKSAIKTAMKFANKSDVVLLSPGAASFNIFKNEFDRGDQFVKEVKKI